MSYGHRDQSQRTSTYLSGYRAVPRLVRGVTLWLDGQVTNSSPGPLFAALQRLRLHYTAVCIIDMRIPYIS